jgi:hypothetical protein
MLLFSVLLLAALAPAQSFHDSLNFIVAPRAKQCFYEDFPDTGATKTIDVFVQSGGKNAIELEVSGPLSLTDVKAVRNRNSSSSSSSSVLAASVLSVSLPFPTRIPLPPLSAPPAT